MVLSFAVLLVAIKSASLDVQKQQVDGYVRKIESESYVYAAMDKSREKPVVLMFSGHSSGPCKLISPFFRQRADELRGSVFSMNRT